MLRRLATSLAATSALVLTATAPALADHGDPELFDQFEFNLRDCGHLLDSLRSAQDADELPDEYVEILAGLEAHAGWNEHGKNTAEIDKGEVVNHPGGWFTSSLNGDETRLDVNVDSGVQVLVSVKGGSSHSNFDGLASNIFVNDPGVNLEGLYAPAKKTDSSEHRQISHYSICKLGKDDTPPPDDNGDDDGGKEDDDGGKEDDDEGGNDEGGNDEGGNDEGGNDDESTSTSTPTPTASKTPAPVPTEVPAGASGSGDASMAPAGIAAAALMVLAGGAALLRRRFAHQS